MRMGADSASFPNVSELQVRIDGVFMRLHRLDAIDVAIRESTRLVSERRRFRDTVVRHRSGYLDAEELGVLFKNMRMPMGQRELDDIVDEIDVDGNGV